MKILIVENEIYLAQSIASKLAEIGHNCEVTTTVKEALKKEEHYDAILLSTNISGQNFYPVIERYKASIIILMVSYISNDTVSNPLKSGANDYILKPFMMEELIRKLNHLLDYNISKKENVTYKQYISNLFKNTKIHKLDKKTRLPLLIKTTFQKNSDALVFNYARDYGESFSFISLTDSDALERLAKIKDEELVYMINLQNLKKSEKNRVITSIMNKRVIVSTTDMHEEFDINTITIEEGDKIFDRSDILSIDNYVKYVIINFQNKFPDTELSKKLGISRKSLWEKRKKYGITKKK